ncbi:uncharacterized protein BDW47DRAFT_105773 [Aspergillus candidus]|uniref:Uncharacterized protein n=1 Tax=Aspergillus candidus TaxID=41067 RepID=A0A2I2FBR1_ASPCN|nr:hypothetical protein BDW47DRAFT_105773 [Aspergillus candidus]PLB38068.1 hypothetical protein BDW47DRAFT_105773 [Aspergillus candidus]
MKARNNSCCRNTLQVTTYEEFQPGNCVPFTIEYTCQTPRRRIERGASEREENDTIVKGRSNTDCRQEQQQQQQHALVENGTSYFPDHTTSHYTPLDLLPNIHPIQYGFRFVCSLSGDIHDVLRTVVRYPSGALWPSSSSGIWVWVWVWVWVWKRLCLF